MAEAVDLEKQAIRDLAAQHLGVDARRARVFGVQTASLQQLDRILALPVDVSEAAPLQDDRGNLLFVFGISDFWGTDAML
jgi:hypothetical protein